MIIALLALLGLLAVTKKGGSPDSSSDKPAGNPITVVHAENIDPLIVAPPPPWDTAKRDNMAYQKLLTMRGVYAVRGYKPDYPPKHFLEEMARVAKRINLPKTAAFIQRNIEKPFEQSELTKISMWPHDEMWPYSNISVANWLRRHMDNYTLIPKMW